MNNTINVLKNHRSTRNFEKGFKIPDIEIQEILDSARQAPTWMNGQHYSIIVVKDEKLKVEINSFTPNNSHIDTSAVFLIFCANFSHLNIASELEGAEFSVENSYEALLTASVDASLAMQNAIVAAESLGYGTVCCGMMRGVAKNIIDMFKIPKFAFPICGLSIGKISEEIPVEQIKPRIELAANVGFDKFPVPTKEQVENYKVLMEKFATGRDTKTWTKKFADFYSLNPLENITREVLEQQGFKAKD